MDFDKWFEIFLEGKNIPCQNWELLDDEGVMHYIDTDVIIEFIYSLPDKDKKEIKKKLIQIDFVNGDVNEFFRYIAKFIINN